MRRLSFWVGLAVSLGSTGAGAQTPDTSAVAHAPARAACSLACPAITPPRCTPLGVAAARVASPDVPARAPDTACEVLNLGAYRSAWASYQPWRDDAVGDWRQANNEVARIGGWRVYAREPAPSADSAAPTRDTP